MMSEREASRRGIGLYRGMLYGLGPSLAVWLVIIGVFWLAVQHPFM